MWLQWVVVTATVLVVCLVVGVCPGCATTSRGEAQETPRRVSGAEEDERITSAELDELTRAFADRYVGLLYSVCDELKRNNPDPAQRREAQVLLVNCATNVYDIASNADSFTRVLDLTVVTSLLNHVWVDEGRAEAVFGERGQALARGMGRAQKEARALALRVLSPDQVNLLDSLIRDWREENRSMTRVSFVRFANFAIGRGRSAASEVLAARGFFAEVGEAGQAIDEARLLGERVFYRLKREPTLLQWQVEAMKDDALATPETANALANLDRLTNQMEQLPAHVAAERQAFFVDLEDSLQSADSSVTNLRETIQTAEALVERASSLTASITPASESLSEMLETGHALFARFDEWDRWKSNVRGRPFDIREQTEVLRELTVAAEQVNEVLTTSNELLGSAEWDQRLQEASASADGRIVTLADQSRALLDTLFWRAFALLGVLFAMLTLYRIISLLLMKRLQRPRT